MLGFPLCWLWIWLSLHVIIYLQLPGYFAGLSKEPEFAEQVPNITVAVGREAILPCVVDHLGSFRVAWIKVDTQTIYTIHTSIISHNPRIGASHNGHRIWNLHIRNVQEEDRGFYMCQINTALMKNQIGYIDIVVPPDIIYEESSSDAVVTEGGNASMYCRAKGYPSPKITWCREDGRPIIQRLSNGVKTKFQTIDGSFLNFTKVTRKQLGAYLCIASNGVPPSISKRIFLQVNIKPKVKVSTQVLGAPVGSEVSMECKIEASPKPVNYWTRDSGDILISSPKYQVFEVVESYEITFVLRIRDVDIKDFGTYNCTSKNVLGESEGSIQLIEIMAPTTKSDWYTKESTVQITDKTDEPIFQNRTFSSQKALDSHKHSYQNEFEKFPDKKTEPAKGSSSVQTKPSKVMKTPDDRNRGSHRAGSCTCDDHRWSFFSTITFVPLLYWPLNKFIISGGGNV